MKELYVQYGCGLSAPKEWVNFDVSPTLKIQKTPVIGYLLKNQMNTRFPENVRYGDIVRGLPVSNDSCNGVYCSHTLEHLSREAFSKALKNTYRMLKDNGIFRCVIPDLEFIARKYVNALDNHEANGSIKFMRDTMLGVETRPRGVKGFLSAFLGNADHLWMWDRHSLAKGLSDAGFREIRSCKFNDCPDGMFNLVEDKHRFRNAVALECKK